MTRANAKRLPHGLYRVYWKAGGVSLAAVGSTYSGARWLAPTNWTSPVEPRPPVAVTNLWRTVERVVLIADA